MKKFKLKVKDNIKSTSADITLNYVKGIQEIKSEDGGVLNNFSNYPVNNELTVGIHWKYNLGLGSNTTPVLGDNIYANCGLENIGKVISLDKNGIKRWEFSSNVGFTAHPILDLDDTVYIANKNGVLYALEPNGNLKWSVDKGFNGVSYISLSADGTVYFVTGGNIYAIKNGTTLWSIIDKELDVKPIIDKDGNIYVISSEKGKLYSFNLEGDENWVYTINKKSKSAPCLDNDGNIYFGVKDGFIVSVDKNGNKNWEKLVGVSGDNNSSPVFGLDNAVYYATNNGKVCKLNPTNGNFSYVYDTGLSTSNTITLGNDSLLYLGGVDGVLYILDHVGNLLRKIELNSEINTLGTIKDGFLYISTREGIVYSIKVDTNKLAKTSWPKYGYDGKNTGRIGLPLYSRSYTSVNGEYIEVVFNKGLVGLGNHLDKFSYRINNGVKKNFSSVTQISKSVYKMYIEGSIFNPTQEITLNYSGTELYSEDQDRLEVFSNVPVLNKVDITAPQVLSVYTDILGEYVFVSFDQEMDSPEGYHGEFTLIEDGASAYFSEASLDDFNVIKLKLDDYLISNDTDLVLSHFKSNVKSSAGVLLESFEYTDVDNRVVAPPEVVSLYTNDVGDIINIELDQNVVSGNKDDFVVTQGGLVISVLGLNISNNIIKLSILGLLSNETIYVKYIGNSVKTSQGALLRHFDDLEVENRVYEAYTDKNGLYVYLKFKSNITNSILDVNDFEYFENELRSFKSVSITNNIISLEINTNIYDPIEYGFANLTLNYLGDSINFDDGSSVESIINRKIDNLVQEPPNLESVYISDGLGSVNIRFEVNMNITSANINEFNLKQNGNNITINNISLVDDGKVIKLDINSGEVLTDDSLFLTYTGLSIKTQQDGILLRRFENAEIVISFIVDSDWDLTGDYNQDGFFNISNVYQVGGKLTVGNVRGLDLHVHDRNLYIKWSEPLDYIWGGTKLVRKEGSYPTNVNDGVLIVDNKVRDQFKDSPIVDSGLVNGITYYYQIFPYINKGYINESIENRVKGIPQKVTIYGVRINTLDSNPETALIYINESIGMTAGSSNWDNTEIFKDIKPCLLKNGVVQYYLNPGDYTQKATGGTADITSGNDGDVMIEVPKIGYKIFYQDKDLVIKACRSISKVKGFCYYPFSKEFEGDIDKIYYSVYLGTKLNVGTENEVVMSLSGKSISKENSKTTILDNISKNRSENYVAGTFYHLTLLQVLYLIRYKNLNSQSALGLGVVGEMEE